MTAIAWYKCDECGLLYEGPVYYTIGVDEDELESWKGWHETFEECTDNLCPECAGPFLEPDDPDDPRRPKE